MTVTMKNTGGNGYLFIDGLMYCGGIMTNSKYVVEITNFRTKNPSVRKTNSVSDYNVFI